MTKYKVNIDERTQLRDFVDIAETFPEDTLRLTDGNDMCVNAKSILGVICAFEWDNIYVYSTNESENDKVENAFASFIS